MGTGSRTTHHKKRGSMGCLAEKTAKNHAKSHTIGFFGAVSSPSGHR
jgi:hypothetical protein